MRGRSTTFGKGKYLSTLAMAFAVVMGIVCFSSCEPDEPKPVDPVNPDPVDPVNPDPPTPPEDKDTKAPEVTLKLTEFNVYGGKTVALEAGKLSIGGTEAATWTDDKSAADKCTVAISFTEAGTKAGAGNESDTKANAGIESDGNGQTETKAVADTGTKAGTAISNGSSLDKAGTLTISVSDEAGNKAEKSITLTAQGLFGLESLNNLDLQIDKEVGLMDGITTAEGWTIAKVEIETVSGTEGGSGTGGSRIEVPAPYNYTPAAACTIRIIITITDGTQTAEFSSDEITVKPISYNAVIPAKAESMYQKFNTTNDRAFERRGAYETRALAKSLKNRNACKVLIFKEGAYTQGETDIHEWRGGAGDGHGEDIYRNIENGSGTPNNILATRGDRIGVENNINNSSLNDQPIIITTSKETLLQGTLKKLLDSPKYQSFENLGNKKNILIFAASGNVEKNGNYSLHTSITNKSDFPGGFYTQEAATDTDNGIIAVEYGISKNISKHGVYEGNHKCTSCAFISENNYIIPRNTISYPHNNTRNDSEEWSKNNTSFAAPAAAAMARNVYDICHPLGIIENLQDTRFLMEKYATKVPSTREEIAADGTIIEDVPNGYVYTMNLLALIDNEIFPAIEKKCASKNAEFTVLYTYDGLRLAYQGAGVEYQDNSGNWCDTNGINPEEYVDRPQRLNYGLKDKYGARGGITIYCMVPDGVLDYGDRKGGYIVKKENADIPTG